jgi:hypothetical protein
MNRRSALLGLAATSLSTLACATTTHTQDPRLVGRWVHQSSIQSGGGAGGFASFVTERSIAFTADGQVQQWVRSVGGGANWSSQGAGRLEFAGRWQTRGAEIWVQPDGLAQYLRAGSYRFVGDRLVTDGRDGRTIWQR